MYQIAIASNRLYIDEQNLPSSELNETIFKYNKIVYSIYNLILLETKDKTRYQEILDGDSLHIYVTKKYKVDDYYANSIIRLAKGKIEAQVKLNKEYKKQKETSLKEVKKK